MRNKVWRAAILVLQDSIQMLKQAIRHDMGIAFFTRFGFLREIAAGEVVWRPFASRPINTLKLGIVTPTSRKLPFAAAMFVDRLVSTLEALEKSG